jgi:hypothetical protein
LRAATIYSSHILVGQVGNLRPIGNRPENFLLHLRANYQPPAHERDQFAAAPRWGTNIVGLVDNLSLLAVRQVSACTGEIVTP